MSSSIIFENLDVKDFCLKNGRYGSYLQINNINVAIPSEFKTKINKDNLTKEIAEMLFKLKIMKDLQKEIVSNCKSELN